MYANDLIRWVPRYVINNFLKKPPKLLHIFFCMVDHFEPGTGKASKSLEKKRIFELTSRYPKIAEKHKDQFGNKLKRTWFFPPHYHRYGNLKELVSLCKEGYGEIELHLHHGKSCPDTPDNLKMTLTRCVEEYSLFGIFGSENGKKKYGFIHGDWALDNSRGNKFCGVNNELEILRKTGCYADFTFPSMNEANPRKINSIYYAIDDPTEPKSYNRGISVRVHGTFSGHLMIIQGPVHPIFSKKKVCGFGIVGDAINGNPPVNKNRIDLWIKTGIHIKGRPDCIFVKAHTHGATDSDAVLGQEMDDICSYLESKYNDGNHYVLHYVTAREMYNIIKALEAGFETEKTELYRNYKVTRPNYDASINISQASKHLSQLVSKTYRG